jgi:DNA-binding NarL/FixJ family response regulator
MNRPARSTCPVRVLLADDHAVVLEGLVALIGRQPDMMIVGEASNGLEAVELWRRVRPDVTLVDLRMPGLDGIGVITAIRRLDAIARIVVLTTYDTVEDIYQAMRAGARGYLLKDAGRDELLGAIRRVHAGGTEVPSALATKLALRVMDDSLTDRECAVLGLVADGKSNREIGLEIHIEESTVKSHLKNIFGKLHVVTRTEAVSVAMRRGLLRVDGTRMRGGST